MNHLRNLAFFVLFFILFSLPFGFPGRMPLVQRDVTRLAASNVGDKFYDDVVTKLNRRNPKLLMIGNSMLGEAVDQNQLSSNLEVPSATAWVGGAGSAWWYLFVKNIIPKMDRQPEYVGVFFRDNYLTLPRQRVTGKHKKFLDDLASKNEALFDRLAYCNRQDRIKMYIQEYFPPLNKREYYRDWVDYGIKRVAGFMTGLDAAGIKRSIAHVFANENMADILLHKRQIADESKLDEQWKSLDFLPDKTFLAQIVQLCREKGITLFFVRVKRRRDLIAGQQTGELLAYMEKLQNYLDKNDILFLDYTDDARIEKKHFGHGDHLNRQGGRAMFTSLLADDLKKNITSLRR